MKALAGPAVLQGTIPSGQTFHTAMSPGVIVLRVGDKICVASPWWMTLDQAEKVRDYLDIVLS